MGLLKVLTLLLLVNQLSASCPSGGNSLAVAKTSVKMAERAQTVAIESIKLVSKVGVNVPLAGSFFALLNTFLEVVDPKKETDWEKCILDQVKEVMQDKTYLELLKDITGHKQNFRQIQNKQKEYEKHAKAIDSSWYQTEAEDAITKDKQNAIWTLLKLSVKAMDQSLSKFLTAEHVYNAGLYYLLTEYAKLHFSMVFLQIEIADKLDKLHKGYTKTANKRNLGERIRWYSEYAFKYWRRARDNWCKNEIGCLKEKPPFAIVGEEWAKLAGSYGQRSVKRKITNWLNSNKIRSGDTVAFKVINIYLREDGLNKYKWDYRDFAGYGRTGWLSCHGHTDYCYLRDCPAENFQTRPDKNCIGERFVVEAADKPEGEEVFHGDRIFLNAEHGWHKDHTYYVSLYSCKVDRQPHYDNWVTALTKGDHEALTFKRDSDVNDVRDIKERAIENGDLIHVTSYERVDGWYTNWVGERKQLCNYYSIFDYTYEIIKLDAKCNEMECNGMGGGAITNDWTEAADLNLH